MSSSTCSNPDDFPGPNMCASPSTPNPDVLPGPTTFMSPSLTSSSGNKGKSSGCDHVPAMMNTRRCEMKQRIWNISCTNYETENTAVHVVRKERKSLRTQDRDTRTVQPQLLRTNTKSVHGNQTARETSFNCNQYTVRAHVFVVHILSACLFQLVVTVVQVHTAT